MTRVPTALAAAVLLTIGAGASSARAQTQLFRSANAQTGKPQRLLVRPNLKADCTLGSLPEINVTAAPKKGTLALKKGKSKTPSSFRCPNKEVEIQVLFYKSDDKFVGKDAATISVKNPDGSSESITFQIEVSDKAPEAPKGKEGTEL